MAEEWDVQICCMGAGYVGGPTMAVIAKNCPKVSLFVKKVWSKSAPWDGNAKNLTQHSV
jgi:UDPglucose 6-dehydrogenase